MAKKKSVKPTAKKASKQSVKKKATKKSSVHNKNITVSVDSPQEYTKELNNLGKPAFFHFENHPFVVGSLTILLILFITAVVLAYYSFTTTVDAIIAENNDSEDIAEYDDVYDSISDTNSESESNQAVTQVSCPQPSYVISCDGESKNNPCSYLSDDDNSTQWLAKYSCGSGKKPCAVSNHIQINSKDSFNQVSMLNRIEKDFYINRMIVKYNNLSETYVLGPKFSQEEFVFDLVNETDSLNIHIVEIVGIGTNYQAGLAELSVEQVCE